MVDENGNSVYNQVVEMVQSAVLNSFTLLDSYIGNTQREEAMLHRQRVKMPDGSYRWVQGKTHDELNDAIVRAYVESGRIAEFMDIISHQPTVRTNFKEYAENWFSVYKTGLKPMSQKDYRYQLDHILYPFFGEMSLQEISTQSVQCFLNEHDHVAKSTLRKSLLVLKQLFKLAIKEHLVADNPIDTSILKITSEVENEREPLSSKEFASIESHIANLEKAEDKMLLALMMYTGMRRGEVLGLRWEDIDFDTKMIEVCRNVTYPNNDAIVGTPKSKKGFRMIPLDERLLTYLQPRRKNGFLFGGEAPISKSSFNKRWSRIKRDVDIYGATPHVFRHTYATMLNNAGVSMKTIQSILGHADINTTMNIYTHTDVGNILDAGLKYKEFTSQISCTPHSNIS